MIILNCKNCHEEYRCKPYRKDKSMFCSSHCSRIYKRSKIRVNKCLFCGIEFTRDTNPQREYKFCSYWCRAHSDSETSKIEKPCKNCNQIFQPNRNNTVQVFCSVNCANKYKDNGKTSEAFKIRTGKMYRIWRSAVFERDKYTCIWCGQIGGKLNADHVKPFALFPELRLAIDNGRTLCEDCHRTTDTFGNRKNQYNI